MLFRGGVDIPEPVLGAQREGSLVLFAGAGVSVPSPSSLPDFVELANRVAEEHGLPDRVEDPRRIDEFLGNLVEKNIAVHAAVKRIIDDDSTRPNDLHRLISRLFRKGETPRIVTTNFDTHFTLALEEKGGGSPVTYKAPALPLGNDFEGVVYLHGSVRDKPDRLILTDGDFGRAYLTEGWATRFLIDLFSTYTVLFVGYSHDDTAMKYLARGLPGRSKTRRYALTTEDREGKWRGFGITPITYTLDDDEGHGNLLAGLNAWVRHWEMGALQHERHIQEIVEGGLTTKPEDSDYLIASLKDETRAQFFVRRAKTPEWLHWVEDQGLLDGLFQSARDLSTPEALIGQWVASEYACQHPDIFLGLINRGGNALHPRVWHAAAHSLWTKEPQPAPDVFSRLIVMLLETAPIETRNYLDYLLMKCAMPEHAEAALLLFDYLTQPLVQMRPLLVFEEDQRKVPAMTVDLHFRGHLHWLEKYWDEHLRPNLDIVGERLRPIVESSLRKAHMVQRAWAGSSRTWDQLDRRRSAIETHDQNQLRSVADIVIDAGRDLIERRLESEPRAGEALINSWFGSSVPLLQRLAIHALGRADHLSSDEKLASLVVGDLLYNHRLKHEVFKVLEAAYANSSEELRKCTLDVAEKGPVGEDAERLKDRTQRYVRYNLLAWLIGIAPQCPLTRAAFEQAQAADPDFLPRDHPEFDSWMEEPQWMATEASVTKEELLARDPQDDVTLESLLTEEEEEQVPWETTRAANLGTVSAAATEKFDWGLRLAQGLTTKNEWHTDLWGSLISAWKQGNLTEDQTASVLGVLLTHKELHSHEYAVTDFLETILESSPGIADPQLPMAEELLGKLSASMLSESAGELPDAQEEEESEKEDWLTAGINAPGGRIALAAIRALSRRRRIEGDWSGLPTPYMALFQSLLAEESRHGEMAGIVLASQLHFFNALDKDWTRVHLFPRFSWSVNEKHAEQAWHGFLGWGRPSEALMFLLQPAYEETFRHLGALRQYRTRIAEHLALLAVVETNNPLEAGWLAKYLHSAEEEDREAWMQHLGRILESLSPEAVTDTWHNWLNEYFERRKASIPVPLSSKELDALAELIPALQPVLPEATELICTLETSPLEYTQLWEKIVDSELAASHPNEVAKLLNHLLQGVTTPFFECDALEKIIRAIIEVGPAPPALMSVCDQMAELGCGNAQSLRMAL